MNKFLAITLLVISYAAPCKSMEYPLLYLPETLESDTCVIFINNKFSIVEHGATHRVQQCFVDPLIRNCNLQFLMAFFDEGGYLAVNKFTDGEFYIKAKMRLLGGMQGNGARRPHADAFFDTPIGLGMQGLMVLGALTGPAGGVLLISLLAMRIITHAVEDMAEERRAREGGLGQEEAEEL